MPPANRIRIRLKAFDHRLLDQSARKIVETAERLEQLLPTEDIGLARDQLRAWFDNDELIGRIQEMMAVE